MIRSGGGATILDLTEASARFEENVDRVRNLVRLYDSLGGGKPGRRPKQATDVLRSAVVLLHAALEEFLREVSRKGLASSLPQELDRVPLAGTGRNAEKFQLGSLVKFKDITIAQLLQESVNEHLEYSSYSDPGAVKRTLSAVGLQIDHDWSGLSAMMRRRHQIVHQADKNPEHGTWGKPKTQLIRQGVVEGWIEIVGALVRKIAERSREASSSDTRSVGLAT